MNYILTNIISYFQEIIKAHQAISIKVFLLITLTTVGCSNINEVQEVILKPTIKKVEVLNNELILNSLEGRWYYNDSTFNGYAVSYHENGIKAESVGYYDGKKEGVSQKWFPSGQLKKEAYYTANKLVDTVKSWWPNGKLSAQSHYIKGIRDGVQKRWHANGQLSRQTTIVNGKEEGLQQAWLANGKIYVNYEAKNGRTFGLKKANLCYELEDEVVQNQ